MTATVPDADRLTPEERKSLTHGEFWIPEREREVYRSALESLNNAGVPYVVSGLYAIHAYTGLYRKTKDLDLLLPPEAVVAAAGALKEVGFEIDLKEAHWLAQGFREEAQVDLIFGMANGIGFIDQAWYKHSRPAILAATPVRMAPAEELIWHRLYIGERHRFDMADVVHLILHRGPTLDWERLLARIGPDWRLFLSQLHFFDFVYPAHWDRIPLWVRRRLHEYAAETLEEVAAEPSPEPKGFQGVPCRGTLLSRFSFAIDVNEWGFEDDRLRRVSEMSASPVVDAIRDAEVWDD